MTNTVREQTDALIKKWRGDHNKRFLFSTAQEIADALEELQQKYDSLQLAFNEWSDKTDWVQKTCTAGELGKHRADALRERIEALQAENARIVDALKETQEHFDVSQCPWCGGWGPGYRDSDRPLTYCRHDFTVKPWEAFKTITGK